MKAARYIIMRRYILAIFLLFVWSIMLVPKAGEWYVRNVYPILSSILSAVSSFFPFSLGDIFIYGFLIVLVIDIGKKCFFREKIRWQQKWLPVIERLLWIYVWFYMAWGLTYYRDNFFIRNHLHPLPYSKEAFCCFLDTYTDSLNRSYRPFSEKLPEDLLSKEVKKAYAALPESAGLCKPSDFLRVKEMLVPSLMSSVGVMGYIGPFFVEYNLNPQLLPVQYPATYAHEMAHVLGVSNEAEANYYGYKICVSSSVPEIRFSGYFSLLAYVLSNAYKVLDAEEFEKWKERIHPEVRELYNKKSAYWNSLYNPYIGTIQDWLYNAFLKGNGISSGIANYTEVISLVIASEAQ